MTYKHIFRFYGYRDDVGRWQIDPGEFRHIALVLKKAARDVVELGDGCGYVAQVQIRSCDQRRCDFKLLTEQFVPPSRLILKMVVMSDITTEIPDVLAPLTELGLHVLSWPITAHTSQHLPARRQRFERIARAAIKQAKSPYFMQLCPERSLEQCLSAQASCAIQLDPAGKLSLPQVLMKHQPSAQHEDRPVEVCLYMGGRSGFTESALRALAGMEQLHVAHLGPYVLRLPTAMVAATAVSRGWLT